MWVCFTHELLGSVKPGDRLKRRTNDCIIELIEPCNDPRTREDDWLVWVRPQDKAPYQAIPFLIWFADQKDDPWDFWSPNA